MKNYFLPAGFLLAVLVLGGFQLRIHPNFHRVKHTWACQVVLVAGNGRYWLIRPNREVFEMYFDNPPMWFQYGTRLKDITYTDDNADMRHFVKAQVE